MAKHSSKSTVQEDLAAVSATAPPIHPIPQLQGPFEESILESMNDRNDRQEKVDSITRRKQLLERERYERTCAGRWKQRPGEKFHPLWKLVAQISFGMHLLAHGLAKSNEEVMRILQTHVDEIDGFLEYTTEDFELGQKDIQDRIRLLRVPLENVKIFDKMLEDREFRLSIVDGNEKIEHIIGRTSRAMNDALKDVQKGINATKGLEKYLAEMNMGWEEKSDETEAVYLAMMSNIEGWNIAFLDLQMKGNSLGVALVQLGGIVSEMSKRAGVASRRILRSQLPPVTTLPPQRKSSTKAQRKSSSNTMRTHQSDKPLPEAPDPVNEAVQATLPRRRVDHKAVRRTSRKTSENDRYDQVKRVSQVRNSRSVPELSQTRPLQHVSSLRARGGSPSMTRLLSKKQRPPRADVTLKPSPPEKDTPKNLSRKSSFFSSKATSPDEARDRPGRLQKRSSSFPPGSSYFTLPAPPSVPDGVVSEPDSEAATSTSAAPAPFVPTRRQPPRRIESGNASIARALARNTSNPIPNVLVDATAITTNARSENDFATVESSHDQHWDDTLTALPEAQPQSDPKTLRRVLALSRNPKPPKRTISLRKSKPKLSLFPVKSSEYLSLNHRVTSPTNFTPHYPPRPSSTPPFTDRALARNEPHQERSPLQSFPRPLTPTDSETSTPKNIPDLAASPSDSPGSIAASLRPLPIPPRSVKRQQAKSAIADYTNTSTELLELLAASPPASFHLSKHMEHPNPLRSHAPTLIPTTVPSPRGPVLGDKPRSPPLHELGGPAMMTRDFVTHPRMPVRKSTSGDGSGKKGLKRIFSRSQGSKRETRTSSGGDDKWFSGMSKDGAWVKK